MPGHRVLQVDAGRGPSGKLTGAAAYWVNGPVSTSREDAEILRALREGGAPEEEIEKLALEAKGSDDYEIWPENADALNAFMFAAGSQWRTISGPGGFVFQGLEYSEVERAFRMNPPKLTTEAEAWWGIRVLEAEATRLRNEKLERK